ncbi:MAG TPA: hypothetical protein VF407_18570, partial [Polyangiaceae bacterium]
YRLYCPDGQACVQVKNTGIAGSSPRALLGPSGNLLLVATESSTSQASLVPCPLTSTGSCSAVAGLTAGSSIDAKAQSIDAAVDPASKKVVVATIGPATSGLDSNPHALGRCSADGASCTFVDFASTVTGANGSVTVDPESGQIFALSQGTSAGSTPTLFFLE